MSNFDFTTKAYTEQLSEHKLTGSRCTQCGKLSLPPRKLCPVCHSSQLEPFEFSGQGKLAAFSVIYIAPSAMIAAGYDRKTPYCAGVVELVEGPRISAQILGVDVTRPEEIRIGSPVSMTFIEREQGDTRKVFLGFEV
jgi:uncharacterized protein